MKQKEETTNTDKMRDLERTRQQIAKHAEERMAEFMKGAQEDYCNFFHWYAGDMYKLKMKHDYFTDMPQIKEDADIEIVKKQLQMRIKNIEHELINRSAFGSCTDEIINLEHRLKLEAQRAIRESLQNMAWMLEY